LKAECDLYDNCWIYEYSDISGGENKGDLAPTSIYNASKWISNGVSISISYFTEPSLYGLVSEISDSYGRSWDYYYNIEVVDYGDFDPDYFIGLQGIYPRLSRVENNFSSIPQWQYAYYTPAADSFKRRPSLLVSAKDYTSREIAKIEYYNENDSSFNRWKVKRITNEEGILEYSGYSGCPSPVGYCSDIQKQINGNLFKINIDLETGFIKSIQDPLGTCQKEPFFNCQKYCYKNNRLVYYKDESNNYTRYAYNEQNGALQAIVRNACPYNESTC